MEVARQRLKPWAMSGGQLIDTIAPGSEIDRQRSEVAAGGPVTASHQCAGCGGVITDRFLLRAVSKYWHEACLRCGACSCRLGEVGSSLYEKADLILCRRDYLRLFGSSGQCAACSKPIPAFEMVMRARELVYHLECFACRHCNHRFCVGDRYYMHGGQILCELDYEEQRASSHSSHPSSTSAVKRNSSAEASVTGRSPAPPSASTAQQPCSVH